jgi:hypothetical protein
MPLHDKYVANLAEAKDFEDFVFDTMLYEKRLVVGGYKSRHYQTLHGESLTGVEVKLDRRFRETGRLFIETSETHHESAQAKPSGIYHKADPWLIVIGDYSTIWAFATSTLRHINECGSCESRATKTSSGFLLPLDKADRFAAFKWEA